MNLTHKKLVIHNFKGIEHLEFIFGQVSNIYAKNKGGKTSLADALTWVFTGKDTQGRADYEIKNSKKRELNRGDHYVELTSDRDGTEIVFRRSYKEKWQTPKGQDEAVMTGHTTSFAINTIEKSEKDYKDFIETILPENVLKMISNPTYFPSLPWQDQRIFIISVAGDIPNETVLGNIVTPANKKDFAGLVAAFADTSYSKDKVVSEYKQHVKNRIKKISDEQATIAPKIQENIRNKPESVNLPEIKNNIVSLEAKLEIIDTSINDKSQAATLEQQAVTDIKLQIQKLNSSNQDIKYNLQSAYTQENHNRTELVAGAERQLSSLNDKISFKEKDITSHKERINEIAQQKVNMIAQWHEENEKELKFDTDKFVCQTCKRDLPADNIQEQKQQMIANYNSNKQTILDEITKKGKGLSVEQDQLKGVVEVWDAELTLLKQVKVKAADELANARLNASGAGAIKSVDERVRDSAEYRNNLTEVSRLQSQLGDRPGFDYYELKQQRAGIVAELDAEKKKLSINERIEEIDKRIAELKAEEKKLASEIAKLQKEDFAIQQFIVAKVDAITHRINALFTNIEFTLFDKQLNGAINPTCELTLDKVRYGALNTEGKLNAGLDIINAISRHYDAYAPIIIDNRESVTEIIPVKAQVINLFVSPDHEKLTLK